MGKAAFHKGCRPSAGSRGTARLVGTVRAICKMLLQERAGNTPKGEQPGQKVLVGLEKEPGPHHLLGKKRKAESRTPKARGPDGER